MRIAFISTIGDFRWGGADILWTCAAEAALARGDSVLVATTPVVAGHERVQRLVAGGARQVFRAPTPVNFSLAARVLRRTRRLFVPREPLIRALVSFAPEVVVVSCAGTYDLFAERELRVCIANVGAALRVIANFQWENPELSPEARAVITHTFASADAVFFVSAHNLAVTRRHLLSLPASATTIQVPVRWSPTNLNDWPAQTGWRLATVGRIHPLKGLPLLLHAIVEAIGKEPDWHLNIYGEGPEEEYVRETADVLGLASRVSFRGWVDDLEKIWSENHLLLSPAHGEGIPLTIPEAMLRGRPVFATCVGGAEDWIQHGISGFLCPAPTFELLTATLREAWASRSKWRQMGDAAAVSARLRYNPDDVLRVIAPCGVTGVRTPK